MAVDWMSGIHEVEIFSPVGDVLVDCQQPASVVVLMDGGPDGSFEDTVELHLVHHFQQ